MGIIRKSTIRKRKTKKIKKRKNTHTKKVFSNLTRIFIYNFCNSFILVKKHSYVTNLPCQVPLLCQQSSSVNLQGNIGAPPPGYPVQGNVISVVPHNLECSSIPNNMHFSQPVIATSSVGQGYSDNRPTALPNSDYNYSTYNYQQSLGNSPQPIYPPYNYRNASSYKETTSQVQRPFSPDYPSRGASGGLPPLPK
jgi:hypothetical protein